MDDDKKYPETPELPDGGEKKKGDDDQTASSSEEKAAEPVHPPLPKPPAPPVGMPAWGAPPPDPGRQAFPGWSPGKPAGPPPGPGQPPPGFNWQPEAPKKGVFKQHPVLIILILLMAAGAMITIIAAAVGGGSGGMSVMSFGNKVGVVKIEGLIMDSKETIEQIHRFRDDSSISAVVLRVDSPGGTVGASQEIHAEVKKLQKKKPVVVSMGQMAASGGYYVSCPAQVIYSNEGTITGSIGVIMELTNLEGLMEWIKVKKFALTSAKFKDAGSPYRDMTKEERVYMQEIVDNLHAQFVTAVADGRKDHISADEAAKLANGKIYTGEMAVELGLVDEIGGLFDAIAKAGELGKIEGEPKVVWPPKKPVTFMEALIGNVFPGVPQKSKMLFDSPLRAMYVIDI
jgi:protease IV